jgi:hypothetical protein
MHIRPDFEWFAHSLIPAHASAYVGSVSDHHAENGNTKSPESLCRMLALPPSGRRGPPPARTLLPGHCSYGLIRQSRSALPYFGLSLVRDGAIWQAIAAQRGAGYGNPAEARQSAAEALKLGPTSEDVEVEAALAFAVAGDTARAESLAQDCGK